MVSRTAGPSDDLRARLQEALGSAYTLERELGGGGMSRVFVARDERLGRHVAVKVLHPNLSADVSAVRFEREILVAARLHHPHLVPLLSAGTVDGLPFYTMPFVEGETLRARLARAGALSVGEAVRLVRELADALAYAHEQGVVHRDLKPENVLLSRGHALVTDFGVSKALASATQGASGVPAAGTATGLGVAMGTPAYMAPEQAVGDPATDHRADLYALGVIAYEALAGAHPFAGRAPQAVVAAHLTEAPPPLAVRRPDAPPALAALVMQCLAKDPADRPQTADSVSQALDALATPAGGMGAAGVAPAGTRLAPDRRRLGLAAAALLLLASGAVAVHRARSGVTDAAAPAAARATASSLAVLPLANVGADTANEYFAQGMADELTGALARVPGLRVASRTAAAGVLRRRPDADAREVGRELGVGVVLEGTVRRAAGRLRLTAQLTSVAGGHVLWAEKYERAVGDVFAVQDDIARSIVEALRPRLVDGSDSARATITVAGTRDLEAHEHYLRARYLWARRTRLTEAMALLRQAIARDPNYADAYAALAAVYVTLPDWAQASVDTTHPRTVEYAERALALDSTRAEAHAALASTYMTQRRFDEAEREYRLAIALDPGSTTAHLWYALHLSGRGRAEEALAELRRAHELDPLSPNILGWYAQALATAGRAPEAERRLRALIATEPELWTGYAQLAAVLAAVGRGAEAQAYADSAMRLGGAATAKHQYALGVAGLAYARGGRVADARRMLERVRLLVGPRDERGAWSHAEAMILIGLGQPDSALAVLRREVDRGHVTMLNFAAITPALVPLHSDPRYTDLFRRAALPPGPRP